MLDEIGTDKRQFTTATLELPFGRGMNLQIKVADVDSLYRRICETDLQVVIPLEERWYRQGEQEAGNRQFVVADPDGYLLRFFSSLGRRPMDLNVPGTPPPFR